MGRVNFMNIEQYERLSMQKLNSSSVQTKASEGAITVSMLGGSSGSVTPDGALRIETFYSCVRDKAESIGQLPVKLYQRDSDGKRTEIKTGRSHRIYTVKPCDYLTMQGFMEMMVASLETRGAFYAYKERNDRGNIKSIIPFRYQSNVKPNMDQFGRVYYTYVTNDGKIADPYRTEDLFIVHGFTMDGVVPISPVAYMADLLGMASAQENSYKELQENGITSQMALATEGVFNDENAIKRLKDDWTQYRGVNGHSKIPILEQGLKPVSLKLTPQETDLLNNRNFSVDRISSITRVPLYRIGRDSKVSKGVLPELDESYMRNALNPILNKFETAMNEVITDPSMFIEINRNAFYAGSPWRLAEHIEKSVKGGLIMVNEGRDAMGYEPAEGGDVFAVDNNNVTYGTWDQLPSIREQINGREATPTNNEVPNE